MPCAMPKSNLETDSLAVNARCREQHACAVEVQAPDATAATYDIGKSDAKNEVAITGLPELRNI